MDRAQHFAGPGLGDRNFKAHRQKDKEIPPIEDKYKGESGTKSLNKNSGIEIVRILVFLSFARWDSASGPPRIRGQRNSAEGVTSVLLGTHERTRKGQLHGEKSSLSHLHDGA